jgi:predicted dehydrogenase
MERKRIKFGIIGLGLMGKEFCSSIARWCHLLDNEIVPVVTAVCDVNHGTWKWYEENFSSITTITDDYTRLLNAVDIDAIYCAIPHNLHEQVYTDIIRSGKHLLGEKPFGIDKKANENIIKVVKENPHLLIRCSSEFPYFPAAQQLIKWLRDGKYGRLVEVRTGFHHSGDMDLNKPINWKRTVEINGEYGCMGDLGIHTLHIPFHMGWKPTSIYADLRKIAESRPNCKGEQVPCKTWDNATLTCTSKDPGTNQYFPMIVETKRMAPGSTNNWFIEVYGTDGSARFSTRNPRLFEFISGCGNNQGWTMVDTGSQSAIPSITGGIFEFGFSDAFQQMIGAYLHELCKPEASHPFGNVTPEETRWSHILFTAALESHQTGRKIKLAI